MAESSLWLQMAPALSTRSVIQVFFFHPQPPPADADATPSLLERLGALEREIAALRLKEELRQLLGGGGRPDLMALATG